MKSLSGISLGCLLALGLSCGCDSGDDEDASCQVGGVPASIASTVTLPAGCYEVNEEVYVGDGGKLVVEPGVELRFAAGTGLRIESDGALSAVGTADKPILFTGKKKQRGSWKEIYFENSASDANALSYVTIEYAGGEEHLDDGAHPFRAALLLDSSGYEVRASISHTTIRESAGYGFYLDHSAVVPDFTGNAFTKNTSGAGFVYAAAAHNLSSQSTYHGNDRDLVLVDTAYDFGDQDRSWPALGVPYHLRGVFILYKHLTLAAGTELLFTQGSGIQIEDFEAGLTALGTADKPILFSGTEKTAGHWNGLYFENTDETPANPRSQLDYVTIEYGGAYPFNDHNAKEVRANLALSSSGYNICVKLSHAIVRHSSGWGIWKACEGVLTESGNTLSGNASGNTVGSEENCYF